MTVNEGDQGFFEWIKDNSYMLWDYLRTEANDGDLILADYPISPNGIGLIVFFLTLDQLVFYMEE